MSSENDNVDVRNAYGGENSEKVVASSKLLTFGLGVIYVVNVVQVPFGVICLSSIVFVGVTDAIWVVGRYLICSLVCRGVLLFEFPRIMSRKLEVDLRAKVMNHPSFKSLP